MKIKFHPSRLGLIMTDAKAIDPALLTGDLAAVAAKKSKTPADQALLEPLWDATLSAGAKTELKSIAKEHMFSYEKRVTTKFMEKGLMCEQDCIDLHNSVFFQNLKKNEETRENEWLIGTLDLIKRPKIIDIKCAWDMDTFPAFAEDVHSALYEWQGRGYMMLWDCDEFELAYCLVDTPEDLIKWEDPALHRVSHIPPAHRVSVMRYQRDAALEEKIKRKCTAAQAYIKTLFQRFEQEHSI